jgi:hypothetical protein
MSNYVTYDDLRRVLNAIWAPLSLSSDPRVNTVCAAVECGRSAIAAPNDFECRDQFAHGGDAESMGLCTDPSHVEPPDADPCAGLPLDRWKWAPAGMRYDEEDGNWHVRHEVAAREAALRQALEKQRERYDELLRSADQINLQRHGYWKELGSTSSELREQRTRAEQAQRDAAFALKRSNEATEALIEMRRDRDEARTAASLAKTAADFGMALVQHLQQRVVQAERDLASNVEGTRRLAEEKLAAERLAAQHARERDELRAELAALKDAEPVARVTARNAGNPVGVEWLVVNRWPLLEGDHLFAAPPDTVPRAEAERLVAGAVDALDKASALFLANGKDCGGNLNQDFAEQYSAEFAAVRDRLRGGVQ